MSATGLEVFDRTLQTTNIWLDEIMEQVGPDRQLAWKLLSTVLHKLRDRLQIGLAANLGAQLPLMVRGVYYDQFEPTRMPIPCESYEEFVEEVAEWLGDARPVNPDLAIRAVFSVLMRHVSEGQITKVVNALPRGLRQCWGNAAAGLFTDVENRPDLIERQ